MGNIVLLLAILDPYIFICSVGPLHFYLPFWVLNVRVLFFSEQNSKNSLNHMNQILDKHNSIV